MLDYRSFITWKVLGQIAGRPRLKAVWKTFLGKHTTEGFNN